MGASRFKEEEEYAGRGAHNGSRPEEDGPSRRLLLQEQSSKALNHKQ